MLVVPILRGSGAGRGDRRVAVLDVVAVWLLRNIVALVGRRHVVDRRQMRAILVGRHGVGGSHVVWLIAGLSHVGRGGPREGLTRVHHLNGVTSGGARQSSKHLTTASRG